MEHGHNWDKAKVQMFQQNILRWYGKHRRALPWRNNPTPYRVWISEIMLQQTQVKTVIPYYNRFLERFPDVKSLAEAQEQEVLALWSGLGYYSRARNLCRAARLITEKHGEFPGEYEDLLALPGIGRYTAGAICSIAFNQAQPVVDGNIQRVISRLHALRKPPALSYFWSQMSAWIPETKASSFNQAMMELGATVCLPNQPLCLQCPVRSVCAAARLGLQSEIPAIPVKPMSKRIVLAVLVLEYRGRILLTSCHKPHFIPGHWALPCLPVSKEQSAEESVQKLCREILGKTLCVAKVAKISHSISHYRISALAFFGKAAAINRHLLKTGDFSWLDKHQDRSLLTSSLFRKILNKSPDADA
jgi:A/G-specific adenine glycosylase